LPGYAAQAGREFGSVLFVVGNTGTTMSVTGTGFFRARKGQSVKGSAISMVLKRWRIHGKIAKIGDGNWKLPSASNPPG
jgi:hypothetical protein